MRRTSLLALLLVLLLLLGCASDFGVSTTVDPLTRFPPQATYLWDRAASSAPKDPRLAELHLDALVTGVADEEFTARGYRPVEQEPADYRLAYQLTVQNIVGGEFTRSIASLWLHLREFGTGRLVWTGALSADVHVGLDDAERRKRMHRAFAKLLEKFPPSQRGS